MHVDAFFEYCLGNAHQYYTQLPSFNGPASETRDGVPLDEDLALRALVPEWKPKRGRKRVEDKEHDDSKFSKRPLLDTSASALASRDPSHNSAIFPQSAIPWSAYPDETGHHDPWSAVSAFPPEAPASVGALTPQPQGPGRGRKFRWRLNGRESSPSQYPQSAITPRCQESEPLPQSEPQSAIVQSSTEKGQMRRRHTPAVSSAWPSNSPAGRPRGRPPNNRTTQDGQFSTFPVNPDTQSSPAIAATQPPSSAKVNSSQENEESTPPQRPAIPFQPLSSKPGKLQLQVPQRSGGPIRLATPPTVLVNGGNNAHTSTTRPTSGSRLSAEPINASSDNEVEVVDSNTRHQAQASTLKCSLGDVALSFAERIVRGVLLNRSAPFTPGEARILAEEAILQLRLHSSSSLPSDALVIYCASYLGVGQRLGLGGNIPGPITITANASPSDNATNSSSDVSYDIRFDSSPATGFGVNTTIRNLVIPAMAHRESLGKDDLDGKYSRSMNPTVPITDSLINDSDDDCLDDFTLETTWKQKYLNLRKQVRGKEAAFGKYKLKILETVMMDF